MSPGRARAAAVLGVGVDIGYLIAIANQGADLAPRVAFFAAFIAAMSVLCLAGASAAQRNERISQAFLVVAATGLLEAGALAIASIGLLLVLASLLAFVAAGTRRLPRRVTTSISVVVTVVFLGGIALT